MDFSLSQNCGDVIKELQRVNDPRQLLLFNIPFTDSPKCQPNRWNLVGHVQRDGCCDTCQERYTFNYPDWSFVGYGGMT